MRDSSGVSVSAYSSVIGRTFTFTKTRSSNAQLCRGMITMQMSLSERGRCPQKGTRRIGSDVLFRPETFSSSLLSFHSLYRTLVGPCPRFLGRYDERLLRRMLLHSCSSSTAKYAGSALEIAAGDLNGCTFGANQPRALIKGGFPDVTAMWCAAAQLFLISSCRPTFTPLHSQIGQ